MCCYSKLCNDGSNSVSVAIVNSGNNIDVVLQQCLQGCVAIVNSARMQCDGSLQGWK